MVDVGQVVVLNGTRVTIERVHDGYADIVWFEGEFLRRGRVSQAIAAEGWRD